MNNQKRKPYYANCFICNDNVQLGPGVYQGKNIPCYNFLACETCIMLNKDGWKDQRDEYKIIKHLQDSHLLIPERNSKGLLPLGL